MNPDQFSLRRLLLCVAVVAVALGGLRAIHKSNANANKEAVRQAIRAGRIDPEEYRRWYTAEEIEQLRTAYDRSGSVKQSGMR